MIVSGIPESEVLASTVWALAPEECALCQLALMWLAVNKKRISRGSSSLIEVCQSLKDSDLVPPSRLQGTNDADAYGRLVEMARSVLLGETMDPTFGAWRAHRHTESPSWSQGLYPTALVGPFLFYSPEVSSETAGCATMGALG